MTENDKALVARLRNVYRVKVPNYIDDAADRIEALEAENERLRWMLGEICTMQAKHYGDMTKEDYEAIYGWGGQG